MVLPASATNCTGLQKMIKIHAKGVKRSHRPASRLSVPLVNPSPPSSPRPKLFLSVTSNTHSKHPLPNIWTLQGRLAQRGRSDDLPSPLSHHHNKLTSQSKRGGRGEGGGADKKERKKERTKERKKEDKDKNWNSLSLSLSLSLAPLELIWFDLISLLRGWRF